MARRPDGRAKVPRRRLLSALVATVLLVGVLFVAVFPTRTYLAQRAAARKSASQLAQLRAERRALDAEAQRLTTPAEIERIARERYGLVKPGEESYAVLPPKAPRTGLPEVWPFTGVETRLTTG